MFFLILTVVGCLNGEKKIVLYKFKGITLSRCDADKKSYFFYGNCDNETKIINEALVTIDWKFDDFLNAFLIFHEDGTVEILRNGVGKFSAVKRGGKIFFKTYESPEHSRITEKYFPPNHFNNLCRLSDNFEFEAKTNKEFKSNVLADYISE